MIPTPEDRLSLGLAEMRDVAEHELRAARRVRDALARTFRPEWVPTFEQVFTLRLALSEQRADVEETLRLAGRGLERLGWRTPRP